MSTSNYIRPMSFPQMIGTMYKLYLRIMLPILGLNTILVIMSVWVLAVGAFVGPILIMTSNAILNRPLKVWNSLLKGIISWAFLKIAISSIAYLMFVLIISIPFFFTVPNIFVWLGILGYLYLFFLPIWVFIPMVMLLEKKGLRASVRRSFQILRNGFGNILKMSLFLTIFIVVVSLLFAALVNSTSGAPFSEDFGFASFLGILLPLFTGFSSLPYVFVYYEYRARHENYSEELLAEELGYQPVQEMMTV